MAAMTTVLKRFSGNGDSVTYTYTGHTVLEPKMVQQKRKVPTGNQTIATDSVSILNAAHDSAGELLPQRLRFGCTFERPKTVRTADITSLKATVIDIVCSDEFWNTMATQEYLEQ